MTGIRDFYEIARQMTKSMVTDEQITKELFSKAESEWDKPCEIVNKFVLEHNQPFDKVWNLICEGFTHIATSNNVSSATLYVAYTRWLAHKRKQNK